MIEQDHTTRGAEMSIRGARLAATIVVVAGMTASVMGLAVLDAGPAAADTVIFVDTTAQSVGGPGCSLAEAILSANHDASIVPHPDGVGSPVDTGCAAGSGADIIELQPGATYQTAQIIDDDHNYVGPAATPVVTSPIIIEGRGAVLARTGTTRMRARSRSAPPGTWTCGRSTCATSSSEAASEPTAAAADSAPAERSTCTRACSVCSGAPSRPTDAVGGDGGERFGIGGLAGGGGGGLAGHGGGPGSSGGGGGGSRGNGGGGGNFANGGGGGGGTVSAGEDGPFDEAAAGGRRCGGDGGENAPFTPGSANGSDAPCAGGGGGGGANETFTSGNGGDGGYGGGGGGGAWDDGDGGHGGFGGGGGGATVEVIDGCGDCGGSGGDGGFGGGGGAGPGGFVFGGPGVGGTFAGNATGRYGGGGAGLGGAIFGHSATVIVSNSTFTRNFVVRGVAGGAGAQNGADAGGAIFTVGGALTVTNSTIAGNESAGAGAGIVVYKPTTGDPTSLALRNTMIAGNTGRDECYLRNGPTSSGTHNLVTPHATDNQTHCAGITQTADPQLGAVAMNAPGRTPTMALSATSPAVDTGDPAVAPLDDQRGILRPQGAGVDIGAYEYSGLSDPTDVVAPSASPTQFPAPNDAGWNRSDVTVTWNWADNVGGSGIDTANCTASSTSSGEGDNLSLSATCADLASNIGSASHVIRMDKTNPTVTCGTAPTYLIGSTPTTEVTAVVTDGLSGPAAASVERASDGRRRRDGGRRLEEPHRVRRGRQPNHGLVLVPRDLQLRRLPRAGVAHHLPARVDHPRAVQARRRERRADQRQRRVGAAVAYLQRRGDPGRSGPGLRHVRRDVEHLPVRPQDDQGPVGRCTHDRHSRAIGERHRRQHQLEDRAAPLTTISIAAT